MRERLHEWRLRLRALWRGRQLEADLEDEMRFHLEMREQSLRDDGVTGNTARDRARQQFGNTLIVKESLRSLWGWGPIERAWQDVKFGVRLSRRQPGFTVVVAFTLALGIGTSTAMFTIVDAVMLRPFSLPDPQNLFVVWEINPERNITRFSGSAANYADWIKSASSFSELGAFENRTENRTDGPEAEQINGAVASSALFRALGVQPVAGRFFYASEDLPENRHVAVLGYEYWRQQFGAEAGAVGRSVIINGEPYEVIGVMPPMRPPFVADVWHPLAPDVSQLDRGDHSLVVVGRLAPGRSVAQAQAELQTIAAQLAVTYPQTNRGWSVRLESLYDAVVDPSTRQSMIVLMAAVALLLSIACVNVANLMLARGTRRQREVATRLALGASRGRVAAQLFAEAGVMSFLGGVAGLLIAIWSLRVLEWIFPDDVSSVVFDRPSGDALDLNLYALGFAAAISLLTTFVVGVMPAMRWSRQAAENNLAPARGAGSEAPGGRTLRSGLVVAEIAVALTLLVGAGLLIRSADRLRQEPIGFDPNGVTIAKLGLYGQRYEALTAYRGFIDGVLGDLGGRPGIIAAGLSSSVPFGGGYTVMHVRLENAPQDLQAGTQAGWRVIAGDYLAAMGIPLTAGRHFSATDDRERAVRSTIISESLASRLWPGEDPIGRHILVGDGKRRYEIIGVTPPTRLTVLGRDPEPVMYFHYLQFPWASMTLAVRSTATDAGTARMIRDAVAEQDREQPVADVRVMTDVVTDAAAAPRMNAGLATIFATLALILAGVGIYSLMSYSAAQRTGEIGIRLALGARPLAMFSLIWMHGVRLGAIGLGIGAAIAIVAGRGLGLLLYQISPIDPLTYGVVFGIVTAVVVCACYVPARRAMRTDAAIVLRHE